MPTTETRNELPAAVRIVVAAIFIMGLIYGFVTGNVLLFALIVPSVGLTIYVFYLFYRLVVAIEEIAAKL